MPYEESIDTSSKMGIVLKNHLSKLETEHGRMAGLSLKPLPGDVFIVTPPKSGTTLLCQIVHSLRSKGDMSFEEINLVIPCLEMAYDYGYTDINAPQVHDPRVFKTHAWKGYCPWSSDAKYIFMTRDPVDSGASFYHFFNGWFFEKDEISMEEFLKGLFLNRSAPTSNMQNASHWHNMVSWYPHRHDSNVLWLFYEDVVQNLRYYVDVIANFLDLAVDDASIRDLATRQSHIDHMKQYPTKYDEHMLKLARNEACGLRPLAGLDGSSAGKVRKGGKRDNLSDHILDAMDKKWKTVMMPVVGCENYNVFRKKINMELGRPNEMN